MVKGERGKHMATKKKGMLHNAEYYSRAIGAEWRKSIEAVIEVGKLLMQAKRLCDHGEFLRLFYGHENAVTDPVPFAAETAQRLMAIAENKVLSNAAHAQHLPQSWTTLYELTKLDDETLNAGIKSGEINPEMTRAEASALRSDPVKKPEQPPHEEMADAVKNAVTKFVGRLTTPEQFLYVRSRLERMLDFLSEMEADRGSGRSRKKTAAASSR
jgi:hypothetical protein